ncbi:hypothetical protein K8Z61_16615 [Nocardioides sp. TRM66260-LWL]|uniref:hypothetical protein n=1 Tax=Nocardioides sp. TRM66260-LWL TaxID=2874478 RepID=UPI001CC78801|nr:hypothetical protein [Nocardioides sp. TRM66260-LWL]MBZ5736118.1 hypothetical protein [Nocardioides sp. TRM66260-LWL]
MARSTLTRSLHDVGLAAWFGGTLAGAVAVNPAAAQADDATGRGAVANSAWDRWTPVNAAAIGAHLVGSVGQLAANRRRVAGQSGVGSMALAKTALTGAALGATAYARALGRVVDAEHRMPVASGTRPEQGTPPPVARAQQRLRVLQWTIPALTGGLIVVTALAGEQQRPAEVGRGALRRLRP